MPGLHSPPALAGVRLAVRGLAMLLPFAALAGCLGLGASDESEMVFFDLREYASGSGEADGADGADGADRADEPRLQLTSRQRVYLGTEPLRVDAFTRWRGADGKNLKRQTVTLWDRQAGRVWTAHDEDEFSSRSFAAVDYEAANRRRLALLAIWDACARSPEVRALPDLEFFLGGGRRRDTGVTHYAGSRLSLRRLAVEPGVYWDAAVLTTDAAPFDTDDARLEFLVGVLGVEPGRAETVLRWLGGVPLVIDVHYFPGGEPVTPLEGELFDIGVGSPAPSARKRPAPEGEPGDDDPSELDAAAILERVSQMDGLSSPRTNATELFLALSQHLDGKTFDRAVRLFGSVREPWVRTELARALIRHDAARSWAALERYLEPAAGVAALDLVEAGLAETHPAAESALLALLRRRREFDEALVPAVTAWGLEHLRVLSGMALARFLERFTTAAASDDEAELELWLDWWEQRDGSSSAA